MSWYAVACIVTGSWTIAGLVVAVPLGRSMRAAEPEPDDHVELITEPLPPVPPSRTWDEPWLNAWAPEDEPANWDDLDEVMFRWFAEGAR